MRIITFSVVAIIIPTSLSWYSNVVMNDGVVMAMTAFIGTTRPFERRIQTRDQQQKQHHHHQQQQQQQQQHGETQQFKKPSLQRLYFREGSDNNNNGDDDSSSQVIDASSWIVGASTPTTMQKKSIHPKSTSHDTTTIANKTATAAAAATTATTHDWDHPNSRGNGHKNENHDNNGSIDDTDPTTTIPIPALLFDGGGTTKNERSTLRLRKAQRLLALSQISPSQRLESLQQQKEKETRKLLLSSDATNKYIRHEKNYVNDDDGSRNDNYYEYTTTVVPMGSYSMRFGGFGSLEEELERTPSAATTTTTSSSSSSTVVLPTSRVQPFQQKRQGNTMEEVVVEKNVYTSFRMADTFDSVDNLVDSKSSLLFPGGRWMTNEKNNVPTTEMPKQQQQQQQQRQQFSSNTIISSSSSSSLLSNHIYTVAEPLIPYDPIAAEKLLFVQPTKWLIRNIQIALPLGVWGAGILMDNVFGMEKLNRKKRAMELNSIIASLGPAIIKAGQALASRPDLLPSEYLEELQKLQDNVPTFGNDIAFRIVEEELKRKFGDVFELGAPEPVAAASIGQVYKARLLKNGQIVAIKIQRPNTEEIVALDLYVLRWWGGVYNEIFRLLGRDIDLQSVMDDFGKLLYAEIDYIAEAANARRFSELYAKDVAIADVFVPKIYSELTTRKVLTMEWVDGFRLTDNENLELYNLDRKKLVDTLVQCSLRQIMENGFFHADPHAGNLLATRDGRLCYLDFGMMSYATADQRNGFLLAVVHIVNRDWSELVRVYQRLGFIPDGTDVKPIELALETALPDVLNANISELNFKNVVGKLGDIFYTYPFSLPPFYISIIRCLGVLEGLAIQVDPQARIISEAYPYVANRVLTDDSQEELKEALRRLIFTTDGHIRWNRLESLLDEAKDSRGFDIVQVFGKLVDYIISSEGEELLNEIAGQFIEEVDSLGQDTAAYISKSIKILDVRDERTAALAIRSLGELLQQVNLSTDQNTKNGVVQSSSNTGVSKIIQGIVNNLPELPPSMQRTKTIGSLIGIRGASTITTLSDNNTIAAVDAVRVLNKFTPIVQKLVNDPRVRGKTNDIVARLSERFVSRSLRAAFGLAPPSFESVNSKNNRR